MSQAEAEMAKLAESFNFDVTTDFGQIEQVIQDKIGLNRAKVRVAADLSSEGIVDIKREQAMEKVLADQALKQFEVEMGLVTPETAGVKDEAKELGPAAKADAGETLSERRCQDARAECTASCSAGLRSAAEHVHLPNPRRSRATPARGLARLVSGLGARSWPICISPARPARSCCTATCTTWCAARADGDDRRSSA